GRRRDPAGAISAYPPVVAGRSPPAPADLAARPPHYPRPRLVRGYHRPAVQPPVSTRSLRRRGPPPARRPPPRFHRRDRPQRPPPGGGPGQRGLRARGAAQSIADGGMRGARGEPPPTFAGGAGTKHANRNSILGLSFAPRRPFSEDRGADPHMRGAELDGEQEIRAHAHGQQ